VIFGAPTVGLFSDRFGGNGLLVVVAASGWGLVFLLFLCTDVSPIVCIAMMGVLACADGVIVSCFARFVRSENLGVAFGIAYSLTNLSLVCANLLIGLVKDHFGWKYVLVTFLIFSTISLGLGVALNLSNGLHGRLNWSKERLRQERLREDEMRSSERKLDLDGSFFRNMTETTSLLNRSYNTRRISYLVP